MMDLQRESRAVDTESLCIVAGKLVWAIQIDIHILDNGGNLMDAANIAALAALMTFRRPECSLGGEDGQEVIIYPLEVIDPTHIEKAVMVGRMIATINANGDICAIQKAEGEGVDQRVIMQCLQLAITKATDITKQIKAAVETYNSKRALQKIKHEPTCVATNVKEGQDQTLDNEGISELVGKYMERSKLISRESYASQNINDEVEVEPKSLRRGVTGMVSNLAASP
ncbi:hypothetical protein V6N13_088887 [Hibiscus sabdariffa]